MPDDFNTEEPTKPHPEETFAELAAYWRAKWEREAAERAQVAS